MEKYNWFMFMFYIIIKIEEINNYFIFLVRINLIYVCNKMYILYVYIYRIYIYFEMFELCICIIDLCVLI